MTDPRRVLVADDDPDIRDLVAFKLRQSGYDVTAVADGSAALAAVQSGAQREQVPGTGLGLSITQAIVERHGGRIGLTSDEGVGTTVSIALPRAVDPPSRPGPPV